MSTLIWFASVRTASLVCNTLRDLYAFGDPLEGTFKGKRKNGNLSQNNSLISFVWSIYNELYTRELITVCQWKLGMIFYLKILCFTGKVKALLGHRQITGQAEREWRSALGWRKGFPQPNTWSPSNSTPKLAITLLSMTS